MALQETCSPPDIRQGPRTVAQPLCSLLPSVVVLRCRRRASCVGRAAHPRQGGFQYYYYAVQQREVMCQEVGRAVDWDNHGAEEDLENLVAGLAQFPGAL